MSILDNFRQAGSAGQGGMRIFMQMQANKRANEAHQQQTQMRDMQMEQEQMKLDKQNQLNQLQEDYLKAQTPEEKKHLDEQMRINHPKYYNEQQVAIGNATKNQLGQYQIASKMTGAYWSALESSQDNPQKQEAIWQAMRKQAQSIPGFDVNTMPKTAQEAKQSGYYDVELNKWKHSDNQIRLRMQQLEHKSKDSYRKERIRVSDDKNKILNDKNKILASGGSKGTAKIKDTKYVSKIFGISEAEAFNKLNNPKTSPGKLEQSLIEKATAFNGSPPKGKDLEKIKNIVKYYKEKYFKTNKEFGEFDGFKLKGSYQSKKELGLHLEEAVNNKKITEAEARELYKKNEGKYK